ncbi:MAG: nicotinate (nicotinamide) nucleotide adenylyltransferase [Oscillospiraceae bacterium]|jgi:nicotinate-nucleotide adenylyltransferase|nr:nicotinate (nicotinamide) nucleotide adenylyltransferase [Oscillospiraceae bacterium]
MRASIEITVSGGGGIKIGIYGGSFNPVHDGHICVCTGAANALGLDKVLMVVANVSPFKDGMDYITGEHRLAMCKIAAKADRRIEVSDYELLKDGISYTFDTVEYFAGKYPDSELFLILGSDAFADFNRWYKYKEILKKASIAVVPRGKRQAEFKTQQTATASPEFSGIQNLGAEDAVFVLKIRTPDISSTQIREQIKFHKNFTCYLDENVVKYIEENIVDIGACLKSEQSRF